MKKILIIITSHADMLNTDTKTGVWLGEFTEPYYKFLDAGHEVTLASLAGGRPPIDETSQLTENITGANRRFNDDNAAQEAFSNTLKVTEINAADYDAVFFPGGHGPMFDLADDDATGKIILEFYKNNKPISTVCHGPAALIAATKHQPNFLKGKKISCFSNAEEALVFKKDNVPYLLEDRMKELGAEIDNSVIPFAPHSVQDGNLITGQNPLSSGKVADALLEALK